MSSAVVGPVSHGVTECLGKHSVKVCGVVSGVVPPSTDIPQTDTYAWVTPGRPVCCLSFSLLAAVPHDVQLHANGRSGCIHGAVGYMDMHLSLPTPNSIGTAAGMPARAVLWRQGANYSTLVGGSTVV